MTSNNATHTMKIVRPVKRSIRAARVVFPGGRARMREPYKAPSGKVDIEGNKTDDRRKRIIYAGGKDWVTSSRKVMAIRGVVSSKAANVNQVAEKTIG
jgi:hypothetical protein